jgi:hypothetical protein
VHALSPSLPPLSRSLSRAGPLSFNSLHFAPSHKCTRVCCFVQSRIPRPSPRSHVSFCKRTYTFRMSVSSRAHALITPQWCDVV